MTQLTIVTTPTNSGDGTPINTAFNYCNSNFSELYARVQTTPPTTLVGVTGDVAGMYAYNSTYFYYCFADYDGSSIIWGQVTQASGNISGSSISSGTSNVKIVGVNGNATTSIAGTSNVVVVATNGQFITGQLSATGNITGNYILGNGRQLTGLPATYGNTSVAIFLSSFGANTISTTGTITAGNITGGNLLTNNIISATGNITTSGYFVGDFVGNIVGTITNVPGPSGAVLYNDGTGNVAATAGLVFNNSGPNVLTVQGSYSATGNIVATGNISGGNIIGTTFTGTLTTSSQPNVTSVGTLSSVAVTANASVGNLITTGIISAAGNIIGGNLIITNIGAGGDVSATNFTGVSVSVTGNVTGGNIRTAGLVSATGNITGNYILGNGRQLAGLTINTIQNGNSNVLIGSSAGNVSINVAGVSPVVVVTPLGETVYGILSATGTVTAGNIVTGGSVNATGSIIGANLQTSGNVVASGNVTAGNIIFGSGIASGTGNVTGGNILSNGLISAAGNITSGNLSVGTGTIIVGNIVNANGNAIGNIGSSSLYFNTVFAKATSAQYADLAEFYLADKKYPPGTVVVFGGENEVTQSMVDADTAVAGVVSTNPAYCMNASLTGEYAIAIALMGRVPCQVKGPVKQGSLMVATVDGYARAETLPAAGTIIGKAVQSFNGDIGTIEIVVGRT